MKRLTGYVLLVALVSVPAHAILPVAGIAKSLVKNIVQSFVEGQYNRLAATSGPCGMAMAPPGAGALAAIQGRGLPGARMPGLGAAKGAMPSMPGMAPGQTMFDERAKEMMTRAQGSQGGGVPSVPPEVMAAMKDQTPLSSAEADELGTLMERMSAAAPSVATKCKPGELKQAMQTAAEAPGAGGIMRMMLGKLREAQKRIDEARATFAKMSEPERNDYIATMTAEYRAWPAENKQAFRDMVETNFLGMPDTLRIPLLAQLKQAG